MAVILLLIHVANGILKSKAIQRPVFFFCRRYAVGSTVKTRYASKNPSSLAIILLLKQGGWQCAKVRRHIITQFLSFLCKCTDGPRFKRRYFPKIPSSLVIILLVTHVANGILKSSNVTTKCLLLALLFCRTQEQKEIYTKTPSSLVIILLLTHVANGIFKSEAI